MISCGEKIYSQAGTFYDVSQGEEFRRNGYKVVVPYMDKSWCIHDDGFLNLSRYDEFRDIFLKEYK